MSEAKEATIKTAPEALRFMLAGNADFTLRSEISGARYTYKIEKKEVDPKNPSDLEVWFVKVLSGPENTSDFLSIGYIKGSKFLTSKKARERGITEKTPSFHALNWAFQSFLKEKMPSHLEFWHVGRCGRCGHPLNVPESVATGLGPDCAAQLGVEQVKLGVTGPTGSVRDENQVWLDHKAKFAQEEAEQERRAFESDPDFRRSYREVSTQASNPRRRSMVNSHLIDQKIEEYKSTNPEAYYQDGMLDEDAAYRVAANKFRVELSA